MPEVILTRLSPPHTYELEKEGRDKRKQEAYQDDFYDRQDERDYYLAMQDEKEYHENAKKSSDSQNISRSGKHTAHGSSNPWKPKKDASDASSSSIQDQKH